MQITVTMTEKEYADFVAWKQDRKYYAGKIDKEIANATWVAKKISWAIIEDPKKKGKAKIIDHDHALELLDMANEYLTDQQAAKQQR